MGAAISENDPHREELLRFDGTSGASGPRLAPGDGAAIAAAQILSIAARTFAAQQQQQQQQPDTQTTEPLTQHHQQPAAVESAGVAAMLAAKSEYEAAGGDTDSDADVFDEDDDDEEAEEEEEAASPILLAAQQTLPPPRTQQGEVPEEDGYRWRKYGQKQLPSKHPSEQAMCRSYFRCLSPGCTVKKIVLRSATGVLVESSCRGEHNHPPTASTVTQVSASDQASFRTTVLSVRFLPLLMVKLVFLSFLLSHCIDKQCVCA